MYMEKCEYDDTLKVLYKSTRKTPFNELHNL